MTHPYPQGFRARGVPLTLSRVEGPWEFMIPGINKIAKKYRYDFKDNDGHEYQWFTTSDLTGVDIGSTHSYDFSVSDLFDDHTGIQRVKRCKV